MLASDRTPESISKQENLTELLSGVKEFVDTRREEGAEHVGIGDFLADVSLATDQDNQDMSEERITLMTVHAAKGLEFNNIFIVGVEEDLFPSAMANGSLAEIEEERRLLYVAITRARKFCMMSYASTGRRSCARHRAFCATLTAAISTLCRGRRSRLRDHRSNHTGRRTTVRCHLPAKRRNLPAARLPEP